MNTTAVALAGMTALALNVLVWLGVQGRDDTTPFVAILYALDVLWPLSAVMLTVTFRRRGDVLAASLAAANLSIFAVVVGLHIAGVPFSRGFLFAMDLVALNVLLFAIARQGTFYPP
jgi:hypothetical protein